MEYIQGVVIYIMVENDILENEELEKTVFKNLKEMDSISDAEKENIHNTKLMLKRLVEIQYIVNKSKDLRDNALRKYRDNTPNLLYITESESTSFNRRTLYNCSILHKYAEFILKKEENESLPAKMIRFSKQIKHQEGLIEQLTTDTIELLNYKNENKNLQNENERLILELKKRSSTIKPTSIINELQRKREKKEKNKIDYFNSGDYLK